jgi:hypothetical protein
VQVSLLSEAKGLPLRPHQEGHLCHLPPLRRMTNSTWAGHPAWSCPSPTSARFESQSSSFSASASALVPPRLTDPLLTSTSGGRPPASFLCETSHSEPCRQPRTSGTSSRKPAWRAQVPQTSIKISGVIAAGASSEDVMHIGLWQTHHIPLSYKHNSAEFKRLVAALIQPVAVADATE